MSGIAMEAARLMDALPETDKEFAFEFIKKLVKAWDPDYTKATLEEAELIGEADDGGYISDEDIDWENIGK